MLPQVGNTLSPRIPTRMENIEKTQVWDGSKTWLDLERSWPCRPLSSVLARVPIIFRRVNAGSEDGTADQAAG